MTAAEMPGMAPMTEPIQAQRMFSHQWVKQSTVPCQRPFQLFSISLALTTALRSTSRSQSSGNAKTPSVSGTSGRPSQRYRLSMVQRSVPVCGSEPIMASIMPKQAPVRPRSGALPESTDTIEIPNTASARSSGEPMNRINGRTIGSVTAIRTAPKRPPMSADM